MTIRPTIQIGDPLLRNPNESVTNFADPEMRQVIEDLTDSMRAEGLVGMAAPQIGKNYQIFITEPRETELRVKDQSDILRVYCNPKIVQESVERVVIYEGCGSVLGKLFGPVSRPKEITVEAFDGAGKKFRLTCDGILARVIQHEMDHLQGVVFIQKVSDYSQIMTREWYQKFKKEDSSLLEVSKITKNHFELVK